MQSTLDMFARDEREALTDSPVTLPMQNAIVDFYPHAFSKAEADAFLTTLTASVQWSQEKIKYYGKLLDIPRLTAWYGDAGKSYVYSGIRANAIPWTPELLKIKDRVEDLSGCIFNCVLLNLYRNERDSVAWHSDDESELGTNPVVGSVSFGATRSFQFKNKQDPDLRNKVDLSHGSFLLMAGATQHNWLHQIPKTTKPAGPRINLTFRKIL